ncbi:MAG: HAD-IC family P-type ATPase, partial [Chloroflexi bacterium]|nr:HAD-IC family P-type ATPase [Chloroflexota bacterium]
MLLLLAAAAASLAFGETVEAGAIVLVVIINAVIGFVTELRAQRSMEALQELGQVDAFVKREGSTHTLNAEEIVPGDVVVLSPGDIITADVRLTAASELQVDESALTGESTPVSKTVDPIDEETPLAERTSMVYKGTAVTRGEGEGIVVATGMETEVGNISSLVAEAQSEETPLEERLDALGRRLVWVTLALAVIIAVAGFIAGRELLLVVETAIALALATVPEGLPLVATVGLSRGMWRMARRNALIERLSAVETLGATSVICTDKTGTLTENEMTVTRIMTTPEQQVALSGTGLSTEGEFTRDEQPVDPTEDDHLRRLLENGMLCTNAQLDGEALGEPLEIALLVAGRKAGLSKEALLEQRPEVREVSFTRETKMMATFHRADDGFRVAIKGAPEVVIERADRVRTPQGPPDLTAEERETWQARNDELANEGLRLLEVAEGHAEAE